MIIKPCSLICALPDEALLRLVSELRETLIAQGLSEKIIKRYMEDIYSKELSYVEKFVDIRPFCDPSVVQHLN